MSILGSLASAPVAGMVRTHSVARFALVLVLFAGVAGQSLVPRAEAASSEAWFVILGSLPETPAGMRQANALANKVGQQFSFNNLIVSESVFYPGLTPGLYVVMLGPYPSSGSAKQALQGSGIKRLVSDAYVKKARIRSYD